PKMTAIRIAEPRPCSPKMRLRISDDLQVGLRTDEWCDISLSDDGKRNRQCGCCRGTVGNARSALDGFGNGAITCSEHGIVPAGNSCYKRVTRGARSTARMSRGVPVPGCLTMCVGNRFCGMAVRDRMSKASAIPPAVEAAVGILMAADHLQTTFAEICERYGVTTDQYKVL